MKIFLIFVCIAGLAGGFFLIKGNKTQILQTAQKDSKHSIFLERWKKETLKLDHKSKKYWNSVKSIRFNPETIKEAEFYWMKEVKKTPIPVSPKGKYLVEIVIVPHQEKKGRSFINIQYDFIEIETKNTVYEMVHSFHIDF